MSSMLEEVLYLLNKQPSTYDDLKETLSDLVAHYDGGALLTDQDAVYGADIVLCLLKHLDKEIDAISTQDEVFNAALVTLLFNSVRIVLRTRAELNTTIVGHFMIHIFTVLQQSHRCGPSFSSLAIAAVRCLINLTFENESNIAVFLSPEVDGLLGIIMLLERADVMTEIDSDQLTQLPYYSVRLLNMLVSLSELVRGRLHPNDPRTIRLISILIMYLSRCTTQSSSVKASEESEVVTDFPFTEENEKLFNEICKVLFALDVHTVLSNILHRDESAINSSSNSPVGQLLRIITSVLSHDSVESIINDESSRVDVIQQVRGRDRCEEHCLQLLMYCAEDFLDALLLPTTTNEAEVESVNTAPKFVVHMLSRTLEFTKNVPDRERAGKLAPLLIVLNIFATRNTNAKYLIKSQIFPNDWSLPDAVGSLNSQRNMDPRDAPIDSIRGKLIRLMTSLETNIKRCSAELVFTLCNEDPDEFVGRCGFGNAVQLLQIKGLYS